MHLLGVGQLLGGGQRETGRDDALERGVVGQINEEQDAVYGAVNHEVSLEEEGRLLGHTHRGKDNGEVLIGVMVHVLLLHEGSLSADLRSDFIVRKTGGREEGIFWPRAIE